MKVLVAPNDSMLIPCPVASPPDRKSLKLLNLTKEDLAKLTPREYNVLVNRAIRDITGSYIRQTNNLAICNRRLEAIREWKLSHETLTAED